MANNIPALPLAYQERLILFLDILGFKEIVEETTTDPKRLAALLSAIRFLSEFKKDESDIGKRVTQFSDSVVVSYPVTESASVFYLVHEVSLMIIDLAYAGFLLRGGITVGKLIHTDDYLVGPAMIRAYYMESREAKSPRVLMDPVIIDIARKNHASQNSPEEEEDYVRSFMSTDDEDGKLYFDYVSWHHVVSVAGASAELFDAYLVALGALVERGLRKTDPHVQKKVLWLHKRYIASIEQILAEPETSEWTLENSTLVSVARALPRHDDLADQARSAVAEPTEKAPCKT